MCVCVWQDDMTMWHGIEREEVGWVERKGGYIGVNGSTDQIRYDQDNVDRSCWDR